MIRSTDFTCLRFRPHRRHVDHQACAIAPVELAANEISARSSCVSGQRGYDRTSFEGRQIIVGVNYGKVCREGDLTNDVVIKMFDPLAGSGGMLVAFA